MPQRVRVCCERMQKTFQKMASEPRSRLRRIGCDGCARDRAAVSTEMSVLTEVRRREARTKQGGNTKSNMTSSFAKEGRGFFIATNPLPFEQNKEEY